MTKFNPDNKPHSELTFGDLLGPAMKIAEQEDADQYLENYIAHVQNFLDRKPSSDGMTSTQIALHNIGYYCGYYDEEVRRRVYRLFKCEHPVLGNV